MPCSKRVSIWCVCRTLLAKVRGKLAEEGLDRYFFGLNAEMEAIPEFSKTGSGSSFHGSFSICHIYFTIPRNKLNPSPSIFESASPDFCSKHFQDRSLWNGIRVFLKYLRVNSFREAEACKQLYFSRINRKFYSRRLKFLMKIYIYIFLFQQCFQFRLNLSVEVHCSPLAKFLASWRQLFQPEFDRGWIMIREMCNFYKKKKLHKTLY